MCPPSHGHGHVLDIVHAKILRKEKPARLAGLLIMYSHQ